MTAKRAATYKIGAFNASMPSFYDWRQKPGSRVIPIKWLRVGERRRNSIRLYLSQLPDRERSIHAILKKCNKDIEKHSARSIRTTMYQTMIVFFALAIAWVPNLRITYQGLAIADLSIMREFLIIIYCLISYYNTIMFAKFSDIKILKEQCIQEISENDADAHRWYWLHTEYSSLDEAFYLKEIIDRDIGWFSPIWRVVQSYWYITLALIYTTLFISILIPSVVVYEIISRPTMHIVSYLVAFLFVVVTMYSMFVVFLIKVPLPYRDYGFAIYLSELSQSDPERHRAEHQRLVRLRFEREAWRRPSLLAISMALALVLRRARRKRGIR